MTLLPLSLAIGGLELRHLLVLQGEVVAKLGHHEAIRSTWLELLHEGLLRLAASWQRGRPPPSGAYLPRLGHVVVERVLGALALHAGLGVQPWRTPA